MIGIACCLHIRMSFSHSRRGADTYCGRRTLRIAGIALMIRYKTGSAQVSIMSSHGAHATCAALPPSQTIKLPASTWTREHVVLPSVSCDTTDRYPLTMRLGNSFTRRCLSITVNGNRAALSGTRKQSNRTGDGLAGLAAGCARVMSLLRQHSIRYLGSFHSRRSPPKHRRSRFSAS